MTPNFALSLSFEGIRLLHRVKEGWTLAGEVSLESPDLATDMKALRETALRLEPDGLHTKLLLPNDQIKYIAIDTTRTSQDDINEAVDRETPLPFDDLVIDFDRAGGRTQIAAVSRETLAEAEAFAKQYGFAPIMFVAVAEPFTFSCEVFFGPTQYANETFGAEVEITRDDSPAVIKSPGTLPGFMKVPSSTLPPAIAEVIAQPSFRPVPPPEPEPEPEPIPEPEAAPVAMAAPEPTIESPQEDPPEDDPVPEIVFRREETTPPPAKPPAPLVEVDAEAEPNQDPIAEPVFASRTRGVEITSARHVPAPEAAVDPAPSEMAPAADPDPIAMFTRSVSAPPVASPPSTPTFELSEPGAPEIPVPLKAAEAVTAPIVAAPPASVAPAVPVVEQRAKLSIMAPLLAALQRTKTAPSGDADKAFLAAKGKASAAAIGGKPKHLGLILTLSLLVCMALAAMWASSRLENGIAGLFNTPSLMPEAIEVAVPETPAPIIVEAAAPQDVTQPQSTPQPVVATGTVLSPAEAARIYAATGVWQRAPRLPDQAEAGNLDNLLTFAALPVVSPLTQPDGPDANFAEPDLVMLAPTNPLPANRPVQRDARGFILAAQNGTILPTGVWIYGRKPAVTPPLRPAPEIIPAAAAVPAPPAIETVELPEVASVQTPETPAETPDTIASDALASALPDATVTRPDTPVEQEDTAALSDDTASPEIPAEDTVDVAKPLIDDDTDEQTSDIVIVTGAPDIVPPLRPGSTGPDTSVGTGDLLGNDPALASVRPALRPDGLVPPPPAEPFADPALAGLRPSVRPEALVPPEAPEPEEDIAEQAPVEPVSNDISSIVASIAAAAPQSSIVNPTANAIAVSPRPGSRPRNFAQVVSSAQSRAAAAASRDAAAATAAAAVPTAPVTSAPARGAGRTPTTVAQAATLSNAIRLRDMNLIGVYGRPGDRRALIRMGNGRFVKVEVGSSLNGGRVTAIGDSALNFVKSGQTYALQLPSG